MSEDIEQRILDCLEEKPRSITEISRELDEEKYKISKKIEVLKEKDSIETYKIGRSTACILSEEGNDQEVEDISEEEEGNEDVDEEINFEVKESEVKPKGEGPKTIGIVSGKGGVGKTVVTINLGSALVDMDEKVIVMDADSEMSNLGIHLGMYTYPNSLKEVVDQGAHIMSALHVDKNSGLRVLPTSLSAEPVEEDVMEAIDMIPDDYTVLIDSPPGYERPIERVIEVSDELIFVTAPEIPAVSDTFKLCEEAKRRDKRILGAIVNMYSSPKQHLSVREVEESLEIPVIGTVENTDLVQKSIFESTPVVNMKPYANISRSFKKIAADVTGREYNESFLDKLRGVVPW